MRWGQDQLYAALPVPAQNLACSWAGYRRAKVRFNSHFEHCLEEWERSAQQPIETLHALQRRRLDHVVEYARRHCAHYRDLPPPSEARDAERAIEETLAHLPVLEKEAYRAQPEAFLSSEVLERERIRGKTSGTTGTALPLWYTRDALAEEFATIWRQRRSFGAQRTQPNLTFNGQTIVPIAQTRPPFWRHNRYGRQTLFSQYHMSERFLPAYVEAVHETPARWVQGYPSAIYLVARALLDARRPLPSGRLLAVFTSSESLLAFHRETIEAAFGAPVRDRYGVSEFAVSMTECGAGRLHVDMEFGLVELEVEEETAQYERGALLVTGFANAATPLLRYRVGDVGTRAKSPCPCGRAGQTFFDIDGRIEDYVVTPDGRRVGRLDHIFKEQLDIAEAQILQETPVEIEVHYVPRPSFGPASEQALMKEIRSRLGEEIGVELCPVREIEREPNGKFRAVKSRIGSAL